MFTVTNGRIVHTPRQKLNTGTGGRRVLYQCSEEPALKEESALKASPEFQEDDEQTDNRYHQFDPARLGDVLVDYGLNMREKRSFFEGVANLNTPRFEDYVRRNVARIAIFRFFRCMGRIQVMRVVNERDDRVTVRFRLSYKLTLRLGISATSFNEAHNLVRVLFVQSMHEYVCMLAERCVTLFSASRWLHWYRTNYPAFGLEEDFPFIDEERRLKQSECLDALVSHDAEKRDKANITAVKCALQDMPDDIIHTVQKIITT
jgi:hypothetical protein